MINSKSVWRLYPAGRELERGKIFIIAPRKSEIKCKIIYLYGTLIHEMIKQKIFA